MTQTDPGQTDPGQTDPGQTDRAFRCSADAEPERLAGSAPTDREWLLVEHAGPWGRQAVAESRLPEDVRAHLAALDGVRVQLIRRHGGETGPGVRVFAARLGAQEGPGGRDGAASVRTAVLDDVRDLLGPVPWMEHDGPLWLVCTNGRRDLCCAELGRPVTAALAGRWPDATWETTHLGGHRFAATLLALPAGYALGRLDESSAVAACAALEAGRIPLAHLRGRAGTPGVAQVAEVHLRAELELTGLGAVDVDSVDGEVVRLRAGGARYAVRVAAAPGPPRRQSCADIRTKPAAVYEVLEWVREA